MIVGRTLEKEKLIKAYKSEYSEEFQKIILSDSLFR